MRKLKKQRVYVSFIDLEKVHDRVNREALCQVLRKYDVGVNYWVELRVCMLIVHSLCQSKRG